MRNILVLVNAYGSNSILFLEKVEEIELKDRIMIRYSSNQIRYYPYEGEDFDNIDAIARMLGTTKGNLVRSSPIVGGKG